MNQKEHLTISGLHKILSLRARGGRGLWGLSPPRPLPSLNLGLSPALKTVFPDIIPAIRPKRSDEILLNSILDPN